MYITHIWGPKMGIIEKINFSINPLTVSVGFSCQFRDILHIFKMAHFEELPAHVEQNGYARSIHD